MEVARLKESNLKFLHVLARTTRGGVEKNCYNFVKATPQFQHTVVVLAKEGPMVAELRDAGATVYILDLLCRGRIAFYRDLAGLLPEGPFDCIIVWANIRMPVVLHALNKYRADVFVHIGNPVGNGWSEWLQSLVLRPTNPVYLRSVSTHVEKSLSASPYHRKFPRKVTAKPIASPPVIAKPAEPITQHSRVTLGMLARLDPIKDHKTVIEAFHIIVKEYPNAILDLAGHGSLLESLKNLVAEKGLSSRVVFHGDVADVYNTMKDWDLFLFGTTPQEGIGGTVAEALSMGLPVVATDLPMLREWDPSGQYISFCKPFDPHDMATVALAVLGDVDRRRRVHDIAPVYVQDNFSPEKFAYNYITKP
jgi:glycosyltransferase involved in cell wall biosynthesis